MLQLLQCSINLDPPVYTVDDRFAVMLFINLTLVFTWSFNGIQFSPTGDINFGLDFIDFGVVNRNEGRNWECNVSCKYMLKWDVAVNCRSSIIFAAILLYNI